jgi:hypothetical protein
LVSFLSIFAATFLSLKFYYELPKEISRETQSFIERELEACDLETKGLTVFIIARESIWPSVAVIGMGSQVTDLASSWVPESAIRAFIGKEKSIRIADLANPPKKDSISKTCIVDLNRYSEGETK